MKTLEQAVQERSSVVSEVGTRANSALSAFCGRRGYLLVNRAKDFESIRDKIETGRYASLDALDDLVAFSVVIDTLNQEADVRRFLRKAFRVSSIKSGNTLQDERSFDFDCTRVYCRLPDDAQPDSVLGSLIFEVQIRTLLQHAWAKITHQYVYKSRNYDPKAGRLAAELMAQLETTDRSFSRFRTTAKAVKVVNRRDMQQGDSLTKMIDGLVADGVIPSELRPENGRRLGENIYNSIRGRRRNVAAGATAIKTFFEAQRDIFPRSVTLFQLAAVALHNANLLEHGDARKPRQYYVTDELITLFPIARAIPNVVAID